MTKEQDAFISQLAEEIPHMVQLATRNTGVPALAEDLVQEVFFRACLKIDQLSAHEKPVGWLYRTLGNLTRRELDKAYQTEIFVDPDTLEGPARVELPMDCYLPDGLSEEEREIILMRVGRELSYAQIAECKGMTRAACRQQFSRAMRKYRALLTEEEAGAGQKK